MCGWKSPARSGRTCRLRRAPASPPVSGAAEPRRSQRYRARSPALQHPLRFAPTPVEPRLKIPEQFQQVRPWAINALINTLSCAVPADASSSSGTAVEPARDAQQRMPPHTVSFGARTVTELARSGTGRGYKGTTREGIAIGALRLPRDTGRRSAAVGWRRPRAQRFPAPASEGRGRGAARREGAALGRTGTRVSPERTGDTAGRTAHKEEAGGKAREVSGQGRGQGAAAGHPATTRQRGVRTGGHPAEKVPARERRQGRTRGDGASALPPAGAYTPHPEPLPAPHRTRARSAPPRPAHGPAPPRTAPPAAGAAPLIANEAARAAAPAPAGRVKTSAGPFWGQ